MGSVASGWSITSVDIPVAEAARYATGIEDLHDGTLDVIILRGALQIRLRASF